MALLDLILRILSSGLSLVKKRLNYAIILSSRPEAPEGREDKWGYTSEVKFSGLA